MRGGMNAAMMAGIVLTIVSTALCVGGRWAGFGGYSGYFKMAASTGFILTAIAAGAHRSPFGIAILIGLVFSWFGDLFLIRGDLFLWGLISFFIGHVCYSVAYTLHRTNPVLAAVTLALLLVPGVILARWILPYVSDAAMRGPVIAYMCVITLMLALAAGCMRRPGGAWMFAGALLFYVSDIFVARNAFVSPGPINSTIGLPLYFGGQLLLAISVYFSHEAKAAAEG